ncbi:hypothetical protein MUK42_07251 [Musa troglodytarum]|uniref:Protein KAKU4 n=1 Tax=Musa troglodytarum TaxID=320322 RepID=A0A9E7HW21_9LILI|nr:hypothetical protein MUK42_07251 [Musa troglodytarum]
MASLLRAGRQAEERGSGGKILRGRRRSPPRSAPYARPPPPPPPASTGNPRWLLGLISGAGKFISSVFRSDGSSPSSSSSSDHSLYEDCSPRLNEPEDIDMPKELHGSNQELEKPELITDYTEGSGAVVRISKTKLAIEKLLRQETFSRYECDRLTKLIKSQVIESPSELVQDGAERGGKDADSLGDWRSLKQNMELPESFQCSAVLSSLSPRTPAFRKCTPDIHSAAVMEAKKWLDDKKLLPSTKVDPVFRPCTSDIYMLPYDVHDEVVSPVDLAKTYMRSLPFWQSPCSVSSGLKMPVPSKVDFGTDDSTRTTTSHSLPPFKDFKRKYRSTRLWGSPNDNRRVRLKLTEKMLENQGPKHIDLLKNIYQNETSKFTSAVDEGSRDVLGAKNCSCTLQAAEISSAPAKSSVDLLVEYHCSEDAPKLPDEKTVKSSHQTSTDNSPSVIIASEPEEAVEAVESAKETACPTISSSDRSETKIEGEPSLPLAFNEDKDVIEASRTKEQEDIVDSDVARESLISASTPTEYGGALIPEKVEVQEGINSTTLGYADTANLDNIVQTCITNTIPTVSGILDTNNTAELNLDSDTKPQDGDIYSEHEAKGLTNEFSTDGGSAELNPASQSFCEEVQSCIRLGNGEETTGNSEETCELRSEAAINKVAAHDMDSIVGKSENGTRMRSVERVLIEPEPEPSSHTTVKGGRGSGRGRGRRRGRGRGRGSSDNLQ